MLKRIALWLADHNDAYTRIECIRDTIVFGCFILSLYGLAAVASTFVIP